MTARWEYATVSWVNSVRRQTGTSESDKQWAYKEDIYIWLPGAEKADHRPVKDTEDERVSGPRHLEVLNELGAEGWEVIGRETSASAAGKTSSGWLEGSWPITVVWTLKRAAALAST